jgi:hypothetical protein
MQNRFARASDSNVKDRLTDCYVSGGIDVTSAKKFASEWLADLKKTKYLTIWALNGKDYVLNVQNV